MRIFLTRIRWPAVRLFVPLSLTVILSGCSFLAVNGPPRNHETMTSFECTESRATPIMDGLFGGLYLVSALTLRGEEPVWASGEAWVQIAGLAPAGLHGVSAVVGFVRVNDCRAAREALARRSGELVRLRMMLDAP